MEIFHKIFFGTDLLSVSSSRLKDKVIVTVLSFLYLKKIYKVVNLITDSLGKQLLIDLLQLPYSEVCELTDAYNEKKYNFESLFKYIRSYNKKFILINYNVIVSEKINFATGKILFLGECEDDRFKEILYNIWLQGKKDDPYKYYEKVFNANIFGAMPEIIDLYLNNSFLFLPDYNDILSKTLIDDFFSYYYWKNFVESQKIPFQLINEIESLPSVDQKPYLVLLDIINKKNIVQINDEDGINPMVGNLLAFYLNLEENSFYNRILHGFNESEWKRKNLPKLYLERPLRAYSRTKETLKYCLERPVDPSHKINFIYKPIRADINSLRLFSLLKDVYKFEHTKQLIKKSRKKIKNKKTKSSILNLINIDLLNHSNSLELTLADNILLVENDWNWSIFGLNSVDPRVISRLKVIYNESEQPAYFQTIFKWNSYRNEIEEYQLSNLSILLIHYILEGNSIEETIRVVSLHFNAQEEFLRFKILALEQIKELLLYNILSFNVNTINS